MENEIIVKEKSELKDLILVAVFLWLAALVALFIPIFSIPFIVVATVKAFYSNSKLCKVASIIVSTFIAVLIIYWLINVFMIMQENLGEITNSLIRIG